MANQDSPSFEDLEPEGQDIDRPQGYEDTGQFEDENLDVFPEGALGEYEFKDYEFEDIEDEFDLDPEGDELLGSRRRNPNRSSALPDLAARTALEWGSQASTASTQKGNGHEPAPSKRSRILEWLPEEEYLDEPDLIDSVAGWADEDVRAAGLQEDDELMEALARTAATTRSTDEAEGLVAAMVPLSLRLVPHAYRGLWPALPGLVRGVMGVTRLLHRQPTTRRLIGVLPDVLRNTTAQLARYVTGGRPITQELASKLLARQIAMTLRRRRTRRPAQRLRHRGRRRTEWWDDDYGA